MNAWISRIKNTCSNLPFVIVMSGAVFECDCSHRFMCLNTGFQLVVLSRKTVEPLGNGALRKKVSLWGGDLRFFWPSLTSCSLSASQVWMQYDQPTFCSYHGTFPAFCWVFMTTMDYNPLECSVKTTVSPLGSFLQGILPQQWEGNRQWLTNFWDVFGNVYKAGHRIILKRQLAHTCFTHLVFPYYLCL